ncbi:MAG: hypothetical protein PWQ57_1980 [Desulfovibrionales bacterium]|nr:hypothetical protein [Desulfovibrionales bacterium]
MQPKSDGLATFYAPFEKSLEKYKTQRKNDPKALKVADMAQMEIEMFKIQSNFYGNAIFAIKDKIRLPLDEANRWRQ